MQRKKRQIKKKYQNQRNDLSNLTIADLEQKANLIQQSTKTTIPFMIRIHNFFRSKSKKYYSWHLKPKATMVHLVVLFLSVFLIVFCSLNLVLTKSQPTQASGKVYYVAKNGSDLNSGTEAQPLLTIQKGINAAQSGDTVLVREGIYNESIRFAKKAHIILKNYRGEKPIIRGQVGSDEWSIVTVDSQSNYITVEGFTIDEETVTTRSGGEYIAGIMLYGNHNIARNNVIKGSNDPDKNSVATGIKIGRGDHHLVEGNTITDLKFKFSETPGPQQYKGFGINYSFSNYSTIRNNTVLRCHNDALYIAGPGASYPTDIAPHHGLIENNVLGESRQEDGIMFDQAYDQSRPINNFVIRNNIIYNNQENGIDLKGTKDIEIYGNIIYGSQGNNDGMYDGNCDYSGGLAIMHGAGTQSINVKIYNNLLYNNFGGILVENGYEIYNNTIVGNNKNCTGEIINHTGSLLVGIQMFYGPTGGGKYVGVKIKNNIISGHRHGEIVLKEGLVENLEINNNLYFEYVDPITKVSQGTRLRKVTQTGQMSYINFDQWKSYLANYGGIVGFDSNSLAEDPKFISSQNYNFNLQASSPAINAGIKDVNTSLIDKNGNLRDSMPDIGAYEYISSDINPNPNNSSPIITKPSTTNQTNPVSSVIPQTQNLKQYLGVENFPNDTPISISTDISLVDPLKDPLQNKDLVITPNVITSKGGVVLSSDTKAAIIFDKETAGKDLYVTITKQETHPGGNQSKAGISNKQNKYTNLKNHTRVSDIYQIKAYDTNKNEVTTDITKKDKHATITLKYATNSKVKKDTQEIYFYKEDLKNPKNSIWSKENLINQTLNKDKFLASIKTNHLTDFAVYAKNKSLASLILVPQQL